MAAGAQGFAEAVRNLFLGVVAQVGGGTAGAGGSQEEVAKVVLECVFAAGIDISTVLPQQRCVVLGGGSQSWAVGRQEQIELFARLVPDEAKRTQISRTHLEISLDGPGGTARLTRLSQSALLLNGAPVPFRQPVPLPHGSQLSLCGSEASSPFLVFRAFVDDRSAQPAARPAAAAAVPLGGDAAQAPTVAPGLLPPVPAQPSPPSPPPALPAASPAAPSGCCLECIYANACDVALLPPESRRIALPSDAALRIGRQHQVGFFERLLHRDEHSLSFISRSHLEVTPVDGDPSGAFRISNLSANPVGVGPNQLGKGQSAVVHMPAHVLFLCGLNPGAPTCFLRLSLERPGGGAPAAPMPGTTPILPPPAAGPAPPAAAPTQDVIRPMAAGPEAAGQGAAPRQVPAAPAGTVYTPPPSARAGGAVAQAPPWLEVGGTAVRADFPAALRAVAVGEGVTVGRTHQAQIFREAIAEAVLQFTSRDHFRVDPGPALGGFSLVALSSNPLWLVRAGQRWEARRHEPLRLADGDVVQLYTGDAAQHNLYWVFHQPAAAAAADGGAPAVPRQPAPGACSGTLPASCLHGAPEGVPQQRGADYSLSEVPRQAPPSYGAVAPGACQGTTILSGGRKESSSATYYEKAITG